MTGQDFENKSGAIVTDLQTAGRGRTVQILFRDSSNASLILPLSSTAAGIVDAGQLKEVQNFLDMIEPVADNYEAVRIPVVAAQTAFNARRATHQAIIDAATAARDAATAELLADATLQTLSTALDTARANPGYVQGVALYVDANVSENYSELSAAKGKYVG